MHNPLSHYLMIVKRWLWLIILGIVICGGATYIASKLVHPTYQASSTLVLNVCTAQSSAYDCTTAGLESLTTYSQLVTSSTVLDPVIANHHGLSYTQLSDMVVVKPQSNTLLIDIDVSNGDPRLAAQLATEIAQSFAQYANTQLPGTVQVIPAQVPITPTGLKASYAGAIGALVGLGLTLALIVIFEWIADRLSSVEEAQEVLGADVLTIIPQLTSRQLNRNLRVTTALAEGCRTLGACLNAARANKLFRLVMVTSSVAAEGKTTIAAELASFLALSGRRILLVDADLRNPSLDQFFKLDNAHGLSDLLTHSEAQISGELEAQPTDIPTLQVLTAGAVHVNPAELLQSSTAAKAFKRFRQDQNFDYVIIDTPPLLPVADAQVLASYAQVTIFVVDASQSPRRMLVRAKQILKRMHTTVLGIVINKSPWPDYNNPQYYLSQRHPQHSRYPTDTALADTVLVEPPETPQLVEPEEATDSSITVTVPRISSATSNDLF